MDRTTLSHLRASLTRFKAKGRVEDIHERSTIFDKYLGRDDIRRMEGRLLELNTWHKMFWKENSNSPGHYAFDEFSRHREQALELLTRFQNFQHKDSHLDYLRAYIHGWRAVNIWYGMPGDQKAMYTFPELSQLIINMKPSTTEELVRNLPYFDQQKWKRAYQYDDQSIPAKQALIEVAEDAIARAEAALAGTTPAPSTNPMTLPGNLDFLKGEVERLNREEAEAKQRVADLKKAIADRKASIDSETDPAEHNRLTREFEIQRVRWEVAKLEGKLYGKIYRAKEKLRDNWNGEVRRLRSMEAEDR